MKKQMEKLIKNELVRGSIVLFILVSLFNFLNYMFHFSMARILTPADYGILAVLMSLVYIFAIPTEAIQTIVTKYASKFNVHKQHGKLKDLLLKSLKKSFILGLFVFVLFLIISIFLSEFLKINYILFILTGLLVFYVFLIPNTRGILQGMKKFSQLGMNMILESSIKLLFSIIFVLIGWKVFGAMIGVLVGVFIAFFLVFLPLNKIIKSKREKGDFEGIYSYSFPVFISMIGIVLMYSLDIIIAKRFFSEDIVGKYAVASMLGKMIFFGTNSIGKTMFPITSEGYETKKNTFKIFLKAITIVLLLSGAALLSFLFFPKLVILILFGPNYTNISGILFFIGLSFTFISLANVIVLYNLSINKMRKTSAFGLIFFVILQAILFFIYHSSLLEFSLAFLAASFLFFVYSLLLLKK